jgi:hypothetical protein
VAKFAPEGIVKVWAVIIGVCAAAAIIGSVVIRSLTAHHTRNETPRHIEEAN